MKIYDKKNFWTRIIGFIIYALASAVVSYMQGDSFSYTPSSFIVLVTLSGISETLSEEKSKINMEREQQKNAVLEQHFGKMGKVISNSITVALVLSVLVMCFNFGLGIIMGLITFIMNSIVMKPVNEELRKINETANQLKRNINQNPMI